MQHILSLSYGKDSLACLGAIEKIELQVVLMTHLSLFSGIGGLDLATEWAGFRTVGQCEFADYPTRVLEKHWPDVPRWLDIRTLTQEDFHARTGLRTVDIISGGFPCQPFSVAGKQKGKEDDRYLWPEMLRVVRELAPRWVVGENVPGILRLAAADVVQDLEREGYHVVVFDFEAAAVGAPHRRERIAFVANRDSEHWGARRAEPAGQQRQSWFADGGTKHNELSAAAVTGSAEAGAGLPGNGAALEHANRERCEKFHPSAVTAQAVRTAGADHADNVPDTDNGRGALRRHGELSAVEEKGAGRRNHAGGTPQHGSGERGPTQSRLGGGNDGLPGWMDSVRNGWISGAWESDIPRISEGVRDCVNRLKCLGNAVVPQFYPIFKAIWEVEKEHEIRNKNGTVS